MNCLRTAIFAFLATGFPPQMGARAQESTRQLTLREAMEAAVEAHPRIAAATAVVDGAQAFLDAESGGRLPTVSLGGSFIRFAEPMPVQPIHGFDEANIPQFDRGLLQSVATATYDVWDGGVRSGRIRAAEAGTRAAGSGRDDAESAVLEGTAIAFFRALTAEAELRANSSRAAALLAEVSRVSRLEDVGRAARVNVLRVEAASAGARAEEIRASAETRVARGSLARWMGRSPDALRGLALVGPTDAPDLPGPSDGLVPGALERNLTLRDLRSGVEASQAQIGAARGARLPQFGVAAALFEQGSVNGDFVTEWNLGVRVSVPVFTGGTLSSAVRRAEAGHRGAVAILRAVELQVAEGVDRGVAELESAIARTESLAVAVARAEEVARIELLRVENGRATESDYLDTEADLLSARAGLARARYGAWISRVRLDRTLGRLDRSELSSAVGGEG